MLVLSGYEKQVVWLEVMDKSDGWIEDGEDGWIEEGEEKEWIGEKGRGEENDGQEGKKEEIDKWLDR